MRFGQGYTHKHHFRSLKIDLLAKSFKGEDIQNTQFSVFTPGSDEDAHVYQCLQSRSKCELGVWVMIWGYFGKGRQKWLLLNLKL